MVEKSKFTCYQQLEQRNLLAGLDFHSPVDYTGFSNPIWSDSGDLNNDGNADLVVSSTVNSNIGVFFGNGDGSLNPVPTVLATAQAPNNLRVVDLTNDGIDDIVVLAADSNGINVRISDGTGGFSPYSFVVAGARPVALDTGDFDGDGFVDVATANFNGGSVSIMKGDGTGSFFEVNEFTATSRVVSLRVGDFNKDGHDDLVTGDSVADALSIWFGNGNNTFSGRTDYATSAYPYKIEVADFNEDNISDIAVANFDGDNVNYLQGLPGGSFNGAVVLPGVFDGATELRTGDVDSDGHLDLVVNSHYGNSSNFLIGDGNGAFTLSSTQLTTGTFARGGNLADFNNDGKLDWSTISQTVNEGFKVWIQTGNDGPVAIDDAFVTNEDIAFNDDVATNDFDPDGDSLTYALEIGPANGSVTFNSDGTFTYEPALNFNGSDSFTYSVSDGLESATATVNITVNPINDGPDAVNDTVVTDEDLPFSGDVSTNDSDIDGDSLTYALGTGPANGSFTFNSDGTFTYDPALNFNGSDSFTYSVSDSAESATATVSISINPVNDAPVANNDSVVTDEDSPFSGDVSTNDSDIDGDSLTYALGTGPANGSITFNSDGTFTYDPALNFNGSDSFTYSVSDGAESATATVSITVNPVNDGPEAIDDAVATPGDVTIDITVLDNDSDVDGNSLSASLLVPASNGLVTENGDGTFNYQPDLNFFGVDSFVYSIEDAQGEVSTAIVTIDVTSVNDAPIANDDSGFVIAGQGLTLDLSGNDTDVEDGLDLSSIQIVSGPDFGSLTINGDGTVTYANQDTAATTDSFEYQIFDVDGAISNMATVVITIESASDPGSEVILEDGKLRVRTTDIADEVDAEIINGQFILQITNSLGSASYQFDSNLIENVDIRLRDGDDILDFSNLSIPVSVRAGAGNDLVTGGEGNDAIRGDSGNDTINGGGGDDNIRGGKGDDVIDGGIGNDSISGNSGYDSISGGQGDDRLKGQSGDDIISGGDGADWLNGGKGNDELRGGAGFDELIGANGNDVLLGEDGNDSMSAGTGADILVGGDGFDWLDAGGGRDILIGGRQSDLLQGRGGDDILIAGFTAFDADINALQQIRVEWTSTRSYEERVLNLSGVGTGASENGSNFLVFDGTDSTVFDDGVVDLVFGQAGMDWFFVDNDDLDDRRLSEILANDLGDLL